MTTNSLFNMAYDWHGGMESPLYSFASTNTIHGESHRESLRAEINGCIAIAISGEMTVELRKLRKLSRFVKSAPINVDLAFASVDAKGVYLN